jgi:hypothetical protein
MHLRIYGGEPQKVLWPVPETLPRDRDNRRSEGNKLEVSRIRAQRSLTSGCALEVSAGLDEL